MQKLLNLFKSAQKQTNTKPAVELTAAEINAVAGAGITRTTKTKPNKEPAEFAYWY